MVLVDPIMQNYPKNRHQLNHVFVLLTEVLAQLHRVGIVVSIHLRSFQVFRATSDVAVGHGTGAPETGQMNRSLKRRDVK